MKTPLTNRPLLLTLLLTPLLSCAATGLPKSLGNKLERPEVRLKSFELKGISLRDVDLLFDVEIANPYPIDIKLEKVTFQVDVEQKKVFEVTTPSGFTIKAKGSATTPLVLNLEYEKIIAIVDDFRQKDALLCDISGELVIPLPKIKGLPPTYKHPFKVSKKIPAIVPSVAIDKFKVKAPSAAEIREMIKASAKKNLKPEKVLGALGNLIEGKGVDTKAVGLEDLDLPLKVSFEIKLENGAKSPITFSEMSYDFAINGEPAFSGGSTDTRTEGDALIISVVNTLSSKKLGKGVLSVFKQRKGDFRVQGRAALKVPEEIRSSPLALSFDERGGFSL